ncbi:MAG: FMN-binding protein [Deltaproteobacteria bacterium]|nr:FMN-binding protein [Deltaproteobacteria bacterium]
MGQAVIGLGLAVAAVLTATVAHATVFHAKDEALALAFPGSDRVEERPFILTDEQKAAVEKRAHAPLESQLWTVYVGWRGDALLGYAVIDTHTVRTLPETAMVVLSPSGDVRRVEILAFYEPPEYTPPERWTRQFDGRHLDDDLKLGAGVQGITGATLSATALTAGVRRVLALYAVLTEQGLLRSK